MTESMIERVARAISGAPFPSKASYAKARAAIEATNACMPKCEPMSPDDEGWSEWIHPLPGYLMACCDCGLVHDMQFAIGGPATPGGELNEGETEDAVIVFRAKRHDPNQALSDTTP